jgi:hypothetical protein
MTLLLLVTVAGMLGLCWFLHVIVWPIARLVEPTGWGWITLVISPTCLFIAGMAVGAIIGDQLWNTSGLLLLAPLTGYAIGLVSLLTTVASAFGRERDARDGHGRDDVVRERLRLFTHAPMTIRAAIIAMLVIGSTVAIGIGAGTGHIERGLLSAVIVWIAVFRLADVVRDVRAYMASPHARQRARLSHAGLRDRVRRAVWGL